jgi:hypothetical protein
MQGKANLFAGKAGPMYFQNYLDRYPQDSVFNLL